MIRMNTVWILGLVGTMAFSCGKDEDKDEVSGSSQAVSAAPANTLTSKTAIAGRLDAFDTTIADYRSDLGITANAALLSKANLRNTEEESTIWADEELTSGDNCAKLVLELDSMFDDLESSIKGEDENDGGLKAMFESLNDDLEVVANEDGVTVEDINKGPQYAFYKRITQVSAQEGGMSSVFEFGLGGTETTLLASSAMNLTLGTQGTMTMSHNLLLDSDEKSIIYDMAMGGSGTESNGNVSAMIAVTGGASPSVAFTMDGSSVDEGVASAVHAEMNFGKISTNKYKFSVAANGTEGGQAVNASYNVTFTYDGETCTVD